MPDPLHLFPRALSLLLLAPLAPAQQRLLSLDGTADNGHLGFAAASAGDLDGDGYGDVIVGIPEEGGYNQEHGRAQVRSGRDGALLYDWVGRSGPAAYFGSAVAGGGDADGDGWPDLAIGAPEYSFATGEGYVELRSGRDGALLLELRGRGPYLHGQFGAALAFVGDLDHDGCEDLAVGDPEYSVSASVASEEGAVEVFSGRDGASLLFLTGDHESDLFGTSVAGVGDMNQDGWSDFVAGAPHFFGYPHEPDVEGYSKVISGRDGARLYLKRGDEVNDHFGDSVSGAGDVDADGVPDYLAGAFNGDPPYVRVYSGADGHLLHSVTGEKGARFGDAVAGCGDADGDGRADWVVGAPNDRRSGSNSVGGQGRVSLYSGASGLLLQEFWGEALGDNLGIALAGLGDVNGDGRDDFAAGADPLSLRGRLELYSGVPFTLAAANLAAGQAATITAEHLRATTASWLYYSLAGLGSTSVPSLDVILDLRNARAVASPVSSDAGGAAQWTGTVPAALQGRQLWLQAAQLGLKSGTLAQSVL